MHCLFNALDDNTKSIDVHKVAFGGFSNDVEMRRIVSKTMEKEMKLILTNLRCEVNVRQGHTQRLLVHIDLARFVEHP